MRRNIIRFAGATLLAAGMIYAQSAPPANPAPHRPLMHWRAARMAQALGLTDAQKEQAKAVFSQARQSAQPIMAQLKQNRQALADAVKAGKSDAEIQQLSQTTGTLVGQLTAIRTEAMSKVYATLTPDQRAKAEQLRSQRRERWQHRLGGANPNG